MKFFEIFKKKALSEESLETMRQEVTSLKEKLDQILALQNMQISKQHSTLDGLQKPPESREEASSSTFKEAIGRIPLILAEKTYNTAHPKYDAALVRNYPCRIFNSMHFCENKVYRSLAKMSVKSKGIVEVPDEVWTEILDQQLEEIKTIPYSSQVFERKDFIEKYLLNLQQCFGAHYKAGWVNLEDALFLYWVVRTLKPKTIVQTGVCNGLSSAFMVLGLVKNGGVGKLYAIDLPAIFNSNDRSWTVKDEIYGVVIPEGKSSGWMVPDPYRDRFEIQCGDAKELLSPLVDRLQSIDLFYHDSDHTYHHMMFEFQEAKRKLSRGGLIIGDDISWNESVWDFADKYHVPAYNYKGAVGVAFF